MNGESKYNDAGSETVTTTGLSSKAYTPTHTVATEDWEESTHDIDLSVVDAAPHAGETFVIRHRASGRAIVVNDDGDVRLAIHDNIGTSSSCY